jgi:glutathione S-transferase
MILVGQYDSPYVRRVGIALTVCALPFEHRPWSVWGDAEKIRELNPLCRVPVLVLEDGTPLTESFAILDIVDELAGAERALLPARGAARRDGLRIAALATGICDKAVSLLYASLALLKPSQKWHDRCWQQINDTFARLERERASRASLHWLGDTLSHADIAVTCAFRFVSEAHAARFQGSEHPALSEHAARCEALPAFRAVYLPITNNL